MNQQEMNEIIQNVLLSNLGIDTKAVQQQVVTEALSGSGVEISGFGKIKINDGFHINNNLEVLDLSDRNIDDITISNVNLHNVNFSNTTFKKVIFKNIEILSANLDGTQFIECEFINAHFDGLNQISLDGTLFDSVKFVNSNLRNFQIEDLKINKSEFKNTKISNLEIESLEFNQCVFLNSLISYLEDGVVKFNECNLDGVKIENVENESLEFIRTKYNAFYFEYIDSKNLKMNQSELNAGYIESDKCEIISQESDINSVEIRVESGGKIEGGKIYNSDCSDFYGDKLFFNKMDVKSSDFGGNSSIDELSIADSKFMYSEINDEFEKVDNYTNCELQYCSDELE